MKKTMLAFIVCPIYAPIVAAILTIIFLTIPSLGNNESLSFVVFIQGLASTIIFFTVFGVFIAYSITIVLGIPTYLILKAFDLLSYKTITTSSTVIGLIPFLYLSLHEVGSDWFEMNNVVKLIIVTVSSFVVGHAFWAIGVKENKIT